MPACPRYLPEEPLPSTAYLPGRSSRPDPEDLPGAALDPRAWADHRAYRRGIDLFNHGFYWEAHEVWEGLWHAAGRMGAVADLLKGLIRLAAAGVKVRQGQPRGVHDHARGAGELFRRTARALSGQSHFLGLAMADLERFAVQAEACASPSADEDPGGRIVYPFILCLTPEAAE